MTKEYVDVNGNHCVTHEDLGLAIEYVEDGILSSAEGRTYEPEDLCVIDLVGDAFDVKLGAVDEYILHAVLDRYEEGSEEFKVLQSHLVLGGRSSDEDIRAALTAMKEAYAED